MSATNDGNLKITNEERKEDRLYIERDQQRNCKYTSVTDRMDPKIKKQWTSDLRRHPKNQGYGRLHLVPDTKRDSKGHFRRSKQCCLGRLCMLAGDEVVPARKSSRPSAGHYTINYGEAVTPHYLPIEVREWAWGVNYYKVNDNPILFSVPHALRQDPYTLAELNDSGLTYAQIADLIDYFL